MDAAYVNVFSRLNVEWEWLCAQDGNAQRVCGWLVETGVLDAAKAPEDLGALLDVLEERSLREGHRFSDVWLDLLLQHAGRGEELAARVVVQAMLPAAVRMATRSVRSGEEISEIHQVVVAALWQAVRSYPLSRTAWKVARHLQLEMWHHTSRDLKREFTSAGLPLDERLAGELTARCDPAAEVHASLLEAAAAEAGLVGGVDGARGELVELLVWALEQKVLSHGAAAAIADHYREDAPDDRTAAQAAGMSPAAVRQRRSRAVRQLRDAAAAQWAAA
ncbi:RNA polymerase sigma factor [Streptomyces sp. NPDC088560]|uniref:RNA polymerase sigma factor n=1 Tax=Streptomyces sp. NPDC088560 TaxID=3365868 RepID=UPI00382CD905